MGNAKPAKREAALAAAVQQEVDLGATVLEQEPFRARVRIAQRTRHLLHLGLTVVTFGLWSPAWLTLVVSRALLARELVLEVDDRGRVTRRQVKGLGTAKQP